jgi:hypothetical protein
VTSQLVGEETTARIVAAVTTGAAAAALPAARRTAVEMQMARRRGTGSVQITQKLGGLHGGDYPQIAQMTRIHIVLKSMSKTVTEVQRRELVVTPTATMKGFMRSLSSVFERY